jgi:hypothetical protein
MYAGWLPMASYVCDTAVEDTDSKNGNLAIFVVVHVLLDRLLPRE